MGTTTAVFNLPAVLITIAVTALLLVGISESATVNAVIVVIKVAIVLVVIGAGALFIVPEYWHPFIPPNTGTFGEYGWSGILRGAGVIFFAYIGFDAVSTTARTPAAAANVKHHTTFKHKATVTEAPSLLPDNYYQVKRNLI